MDENRISGTARNLGGKAEESFGRATGDTKTQAEGVANQIKGAAQDIYGPGAGQCRRHGRSRPRHRSVFRTLAAQHH
jgi:uncharacterized protein YjbJ (UPF0337 family)